MNRLLPVLLILSASASAFAQSPPFKLPKDPKAVILSLDFRGGYTPTRKDHRPVLEVRADGTLVARDVYHSSDKHSLAGKMSQDQLQTLLTFVVHTQKLEMWDGAKVKRAFADRARKGKPVAHITDAHTTVISLKLPGHEKKASLYGLGFVYKSVPELAMVQRLHAVQSRLRHLAAVVRAGGRAAMAPWLEKLNARLKKSFPRAKPLRSTDLTYTRRTRQGQIRMVFMRPKTAKTTLYVEYTVIPDGVDEIRIQEIPRN